MTHPRLESPANSPRILGNYQRILVVVAAPAEARAVLGSLGIAEATPLDQWTPRSLDGRIDLVLTGIGKANAAGATARALSLGPSPDLVLNVGIAGALPGSGLSIGECVVASASVYGDEGLQTPSGFQDCAAMGFPLAAGDFSGPDVPVDAGATRALSGGLRARTGRIACVSTCSGTDALAKAVVDRTGAIAECMEGAAVSHVARLLRVAVAELRVISNTTGDRERQRWDIRLALDRLAGVMSRL